MTKTKGPFGLANLNRAADRKAMASELESVAREVGATYDVDVERDREVYVTLRAGRLKACISLEASDSAFICSWVSEQRLCPSFGGTVGGPVNAYHGCKATTVTNDWTKFCKHVANGLEAAKDGNVFIES